MNRRAALALLGAAFAAPRALLAQTTKRVYRIAILDDASDSTRVTDWTTFRKRLAQLGLVEGRNLTIDVRFASGAPERLPSLAAELVASKPEIVVTPSTPVTRAAMRATASIPIVFIGVGDPVGSGLVTSLARPGGNVTGISIVATETIHKTLELLRELSPGVQRIAYLTDPANQNTAIVYTRLEESARRLKLSIQMLDGVGRVALDRTFATIRRERIQGLLVGAGGVLLDHREKIVQFAAREKLPVVYGREEWIPAGGLLSYGADRLAAYARGADLAQKILMGTRPAGLPVEQASSIRLVLNMKTARALGIAIPPSVRLRAHEVIE